MSSILPVFPFLGKVRRRLRRWLSGPQHGQVPALSPTEQIYTFSADGREVTIRTPEPPHPFHNILSNESYYTIVDQCGRGLGRHMTAEGYTNNVIERERILYLRDNDTGRYFSIGWDPIYAAYDQYRCTSGLNWQLIEQETGGLQVTWRLYVPTGRDPIEIWDVRVRNLAGAPRRLSLFTYAVMKCDGTDLYFGDLYRIAQYDPATQAIFVRMDAEKHTEIDFPWHNGFLTASRAPEGWDANPGSFIGPRRTPANPRAVEEDSCGGSRMAMWEPIASLHVRLEIPAGEARETRFLAGACDREPMIRELREKYLGGTLEADPHFDATVAAHAELTRNLQLATPEPSVDNMLNAWCKKQIQYGVYWGKWGWKGFRDTLQHAMSVSALDAGLARAAILEACIRQRRDGAAALHGWHPVTDMRYADDAQWLIPTVTEYLKETGDFALLEESARYSDEGAGAVLEHLTRAMDRLREDRGSHGLCLAFNGDWNDSLTGVCRRGRGESVWLSMAYSRDALLMKDLAEHLGRAGEAAEWGRRHAEMAEAINRHAWDGQWYLCALDDDGRPIGSRQNEEGKIFLNMQSWAQLGRVCDGERWNTAFAQVEKHLNTGWGLRLCWPCYTRPQANVGRLSYVRPGAAENSSVYTHGNAFMFLALLERGMADRALQAWRDIIPGHPLRPPCQPNVFFNGFYGPDSEILPGLADHSWITGSVAWMVHGVVECMLGLRRGYDGLRIQPCMPSEWTRAAITRHYRGTTYRVTILNPDGVQNPPVRLITIDGAEHPIDRPLPLDGGAHQVLVMLKG